MRSKKIFYSILTFVISIGLFSSCSYNNNQLPQKHSKYIMVKGNAAINVKPDTAILKLSINTIGKNDVDIQSENKKIINNIVDILVKLGVNKKDIYKSNCNLKSINNNKSKNLSKTSNYMLLTIISVKVKDIDKIEEIVYEVTKDGANIDSGIEFTVSNYNKYYKEALKEAIENGNNKAKDISKSLGIDLGDVIKIDEDDDYNENNINVNYVEKSNCINIDNKLIQASVNMIFEY